MQVFLERTTNIAKLILWLHHDSKHNLCMHNRYKMCQAVRALFMSLHNFAGEQNYFAHHTGGGGTWPTNIQERAAGKSKKLPCPGVKFPKMIPCPGVKFS